MLAVEGILALHHTGVGAVAQSFAGSFQSGGDLKIRHRRELDGRVFQRGVLKTDSTSGNHHVPRQHLHVDAAAGANPDEGIRADVMQLLHGNGGRGAADSRGADRNLFSQHSAGIDIVLPVHADVHGFVKIAGNGFTAPRVAGEKHITPHVPRLAVNVKLHTNILHDSSSFPV